jgi:hypothetical protein
VLEQIDFSAGRPTAALLPKQGRVTMNLTSRKFHSNQAACRLKTSDVIRPAEWNIADNSPMAPVRREPEPARIVCDQKS